MVSIADVPAVVAGAFNGWRSVRASSLLFTRRSDAIVALVIFAGACGALLLLRALRGRRAGRTQIALPAVLARSGGAWSGFSLIRHGALLLFVAGVPFFTLALADPYSSLTRQQESFPGRRIALMIDASSSMIARFPAEHINAHAANEGAFFTTVAAADVFVRQRMRGRYHDLIGLIEFGDDAYVVTPFTADYDNILLSLSLIKDPREYMTFPDQGTTIGLAIDESVGLFRAFKFLDAAGNAMIIFSDGQDTQILVNGKSVHDILKGALDNHIPVYFIRTGYEKELGAVLPDAIWKPAVEATGGRFYAVDDEAAVLNAINDIDRRSAGRVDMLRYTSRQPAFAPYAFMAAGLWTIALTLQLGFPYLRKFP